MCFTWNYQLQYRVTLSYNLSKIYRSLYRNFCQDSDRTFYQFTGVIDHFMDIWNTLENLLNRRSASAVFKTFMKHLSPNCHFMHIESVDLLHFLPSHLPLLGCWNSLEKLLNHHVWILRSGKWFQSSMNFIISDLILLDYSANIPQSSCKLPAGSENWRVPISEMEKYRKSTLSRSAKASSTIRLCLCNTPLTLKMFMLVSPVKIILL